MSKGKGKDLIGLERDCEGYLEREVGSCIVESARRRAKEKEKSSGGLGRSHASRSWWSNAARLKEVEAERWEGKRLRRDAE